MEITPFTELELLNKRRYVTIDEAATLLSGGKHTTAWVPAKEDLTNAISGGRLDVTIDYARFEETGERLRLIKRADLLEFFQKLNQKDTLAASAPVLEPGPLESISKSKQQDVAIIKWLEDNKYDPMKLPKPPSGKSGVKAACRKALCASPKMFLSKNVFDTAWERLRNNNQIADIE